VSSLAAASVWIVAGASIAAAQFPKLPHLPKAPGQGKPKTAGKQALQPPQVVVTGISPNSAPEGGIGEVVFTGTNFVQGMQLRIYREGGGGAKASFKVESPERAVAQIRAPIDMGEGRCVVEMEYPPRGNDETSPSPGGTREVVQIAESVSFTISNSSPMEVALGEYTLFPEEELKVMEAEAAFGQRMQANKPSEEQMQAQKQTAQKAAAEAKEMAAKYKRGEITMAQFMEYSQKLMQNPQFAQAQAQGRDITPTLQKGMELQKQEKAGDLRLKQGSIRFMQGDNAVFSEPVSALKEIAVVPPPGGEKRSRAFHVAFNDGKTYFFRLRSEGSTEDMVSKLKKRLGK
jgi:hypothetical protein